MCAAENGRSAAVRLLLDAGADAGALDADAWTPLAFAARGGHLSIARELLDAGACVDSRDCVSLNALCFYYPLKLSVNFSSIIKKISRYNLLRNPKSHYVIKY